MLGEIEVCQVMHLACLPHVRRPHRVSLLKCGHRQQEREQVLLLEQTKDRSAIWRHPSLQRWGLALMQELFLLP